MDLGLIEVPWPEDAGPEPQALVSLQCEVVTTKGTRCRCKAAFRLLEVVSREQRRWRGLCVQHWRMLPILADRGQSLRLIKR